MKELWRLMRMSQKKPAGNAGGQRACGKTRLFAALLLL
jgi:hypothetical protein